MSAVQYNSWLGTTVTDYRSVMGCLIIESAYVWFMIGLLGRRKVWNKYYLVQSKNNKLIYLCRKVVVAAKMRLVMRRGVMVTS